LSFEYLEITDEGLPYSVGSKSIRDPVHGYITIGSHEVNVLDTAVFQRLRRIKQLQTAYMVYPGAEHSRFQHSLGVMHLSGRFSVSLLRNTVGYRGIKIGEGYIIPKIYNLEIEDVKDLISHLLAIRLAGMLHDVGHGPYSHAFDEAIVSKSNELKKLDIHSHEDIGFLLLENYFLEKVMRGLSKINHLVNTEIFADCLRYILAPRKNKSKYKTTKLCKALRYVLRESLYPSDILDFTIRDSYYSGAKEFGMVDAMRLMMFSIILMGETPIIEPLIAPFDNALNTLRAYLYSRFWLFNNVYFHKLSRIFDYVVKNLLKEMKDCLNFEDIILRAVNEGDFDQFALLDDLYILHKAKECGNHAWKWAKMILNREIPFKEIYHGELHLTRKVNKNEENTSVKVPRNPEKIVEEIRKSVSEIIKIDPSDIIIDYPPLKFFPDNPYLPGRSFLLLIRRGKREIVTREMSVRDIFYGMPVEMTIMRIFVDKNKAKEIKSTDYDRVNKELIQSKLLEEFSLSLVYHWGRDIGVTM